MILTYQVVRAGITAAEWRTASQEWRIGFVVGVRAATINAGLAVRIVSCDGQTLEELTP